jgi:hypothetical protein
MSVEFNLKERLNAMSRKELEDLAEAMSEIWFFDYDEEKWDFDKELDSDHLGSATDVLCGAGLAPPQMIMCDMCKEDTPANTAHLHQGKYIGECCWDDRLKTTE